MAKKMLVKTSMPSVLAKKFLELDMVTHIAIATVIRLLLVTYGVFHDKYSEVPYTDIDYKVFTDAARHIVNGDSPYMRHTFRYSPLIALLVTPNILFHSIFGKLIFCEIDLVVAYFIRRLVYFNILQWTSLHSGDTKSAAIEGISEEKKVSKTKKSKGKISKTNPQVDVAIFWAHRAMLFWLYNPMTMAISTRGNSDSIACLLVVLTLYCIQTNHHPFKVGLLHGLSIHFRLYPIIYSFTFFMYYSKYSYYFEPSKRVAISGSKIKNGYRGKRKNYKKGETSVATHVKTKERKTIFKKKFVLYLIPNMDQFMLVTGTVISLLGLTGIFYFFYGNNFLYESVIYHFVRVDFRHNFSLYFYLQYLTAFVKMSVWYTGNIWQPILMNLPPIVLLLKVSCYYGLSKFSLNFAVLVQTIIFVVYNKVITSQYFVWIMGVLPLCLWQIKLSKISVFTLLFIWFLAQAAWLLPAYLLEFQGENTFLYIWIQGVSLFCAHIGILGRLIKNFVPTVENVKKLE